MFFLRVLIGACRLMFREGSFWRDASSYRLRVIGGKRVVVRQVVVG
jgi:hypothetical protein